MKAIQARVTVCQDAQTEHVLNRQSLGIGRVNHILRVHGDELVRNGASLNRFDESQREVMDRLFPGLSDEGHEQASFAAAFGGLGWRRASDTAQPAQLGAVVAAGPKVRSMAAAAVKAGLIGEGLLEERLAGKTRLLEEAFLRSLDEVEKVKAEDFLRRAKHAAEEQLLAMATGVSEAIQAPRVDATYIGLDDQAEGSASDTHDGGDGDPEGRGRSLTAPHLQKELSMLLDCTQFRSHTSGCAISMPMLAVC